MDTDRSMKSEIPKPKYSNRVNRPTRMPAAIHSMPIDKMVSSLSLILATTRVAFMSLEIYLLSWIVDDYLVVLHEVLADDAIQCLLKSSWQTRQIDRKGNACTTKNHAKSWTRT